MTKCISSLVAVFAVSGAASAHAGDHGTLHFLEALLHYFSEPVHGGLLLAAVGGLVVWHFRAKRSQR